MTTAEQAAARDTFERELCALLARYGAAADGELERTTHVAVEALVEALAETEFDETNLTPLDVVRIRANKFAATRVPSTVFRAPQQLAAMRAEILALASAWLGPDARSSRFGR